MSDTLWIMVVRWSVIVPALLSLSTVGFLALIANHLIDDSNDSTEEQKRAVYMFSEVHSETMSDTNLCQTRECSTVAEYIRNSIDSSVDPCDDFFTFSCGGWIRRNPIPKSYNDYSTFTKLSKVIEGELRDLLQASNMSRDGPRNEALLKTRDFYRSCMDEKQIETLGAKPMLDFIQQIGSWSICEDGSWNKSSWDIHEVLQRLQSSYYPAPPFFSVEVTNDHLNSTKHLIKVSTTSNTD